MLRPGERRADSAGHSRIDGSAHPTEKLKIRRVSIDSFARAYSPVRPSRII
jgi:hypothetical protein